MLAHELAEQIVCSVRLTEDCRNERVLRAANGAEVAALLRDHAPALLYEDGMTALPVDFRECRADWCAEGAREGQVVRSDDGERVTAFTHVVDCRSGHIEHTEAWGGVCSGSRRGNLYLQYWLYYPGSATAEGSTPLRRPIRKLSGLLGHSTYHPDDWEGFQVRLGRNGAAVRATSHQGYNGWVPATDRYYISGGSHAGRPLGALSRSWLRLRFAPPSRSTKDGRLVLVALEALPDLDDYSFAISPPWDKRVWWDPEFGRTD